MSQNLSARSLMAADFSRGHPWLPTPLPVKSRPTGLTLSRPKGSAVQSPLVPTWGVPIAEIPQRVMDLGIGEEGAGPTGDHPSQCVIIGNGREPPKAQMQP